MGDDLIHLKWRRHVAELFGLAAIELTPGSGGQLYKFNISHREPGFVKVHAAEALIELGSPAGVRDVFIAQEREHRSLPMSL